jgi:8-oxo-dGTP pyrophosphatase MutT (NUDIX family)
VSTGDRPITGGARSAKVVRPSQLRKLRGCEQVAAVCYRLNGRGVEFLLVQTRKGRWTFPKGGVEPGLTHAQTAALEAFEEAGVHGRMEEESFTRYVRRKRGDLEGPAARRIVVHAHLCEVSRLGPPQEARRSPTWFSREKAKQRLQQNRTPHDGTEFARVVDRAVARIERLRNPACAAGDALRKAQFEAALEPGVHARIEAALFAYIRRRGGVRRSAVVELAPNAQRGKVLQLGLPLDGNPRLLEARTPDYPTDPAQTAEAKAGGTGRTSRRSAP